MSAGETTERLRADIDSGRTGEKVAGSDPALAPLGTDQEAAGHPPSSEEITQARWAENARPTEVGGRGGLGHAWILVGFAVIFAIALLAWGTASNKLFYSQSSEPPRDSTTGLGR